MANTKDKYFNYYIEVLKKGRDLFYKNNPQVKSGGLAWAYRQLGKYNEISMSHINYMNRKWTNEIPSQT